MRNYFETKNIRVTIQQVKMAINYIGGELEYG